jgi:hypothetical protein
MSISQIVYIGPYFKVYMPKEKYTDGSGRCPICGEASWAKFCKNDGSQINAVEKERMADFYKFCESAFGNGDQFATSNDSGDYKIVIANLPNQGGIYISEEGEYTIPNNYLSDDWQRLMDALQKAGIDFETHFGVVSFFR